MKNHDWSRAFSPMSMRDAYKLLIIEDRDRREKDRYRNAHREGEDVYACPFCQDTGYTSIALYCGSFGDWHKCARACDCNATPVNQRAPRIIDGSWTFAEDGRWYPASADASPRCGCSYCRQKGKY